jgi:hypothetical protein
MRVSWPWLTATIWPVRVSLLCVSTAVPPPASEPTNTLLVRNFVRPFTLKAVKDLLAETGTVINFWMNDIKTHCYVSVRAPPLFDLFYLLSPSMANAGGDILQYESAEQATATRDAIYGLIWPPGNTSKPLTAEFASPKELEEKAPPKAVAEERAPERGRERERCVLPPPILCCSLCGLLTQPGVLPTNSRGAEQPQRKKAAPGMCRVTPSSRLHVHAPSRH